MYKNIKKVFFLENITQLIYVGMFLATEVPTTKPTIKLCSQIIKSGYDVICHGSQIQQGTYIKII